MGSARPDPAGSRQRRQPLLLVSIPFAATGAIGLLIATGAPMSVPAMIGMLMLIGSALVPTLTPSSVVPGGRAGLPAPLCALARGIFPSDPPAY
ncbi:hypothetical protein [Streptomyces sp. enrichment culture]|uniref:hypothetical protein n=1 Tax=Streptomyces sp. enrichment culture TaxID=1795815 RepID=UPI003F555F0F